MMQIYRVSTKISQDFNDPEGWWFCSNGVKIPNKPRTPCCLPRFAERGRGSTGFLGKKLLMHPSISGLRSGALGVRGKGGGEP